MLEARSLADPPEIRSDGGRLVVEGVAIRYGARSKPILGRFVEEIRPGAATKTIQEQDVMALHEHRRELFLGRLSSGTLRLHNSDTELRYEVDLPDTSAGRDVARLIERGDLRGSSVGFRALPKSVEWSVLPDGMALRSVRELSLDHVATTCFPAYIDTSAEIAFRSLADQRSLDLRSVLDAAERGELAHLIADDERDDEPEGRSGTLHRRPAHWFV